MLELSYRFSYNAYNKDFSCSLSYNMYKSIFSGLFSPNQNHYSKTRLEIILKSLKFGQFTGCLLVENCLSFRLYAMINAHNTNEKGNIQFFLHEEKKLC